MRAVEHNFENIRHETGEQENGCLVKSSQVFNPHNSKISQRMQAKTLCVRAGRCGAAPPVFQLPDGLIYVLFLSHFGFSV
jgi:hypothetical protein